MARRTFTQERPALADDPPEFTLDGVGQLTKDPWSQVFRCLGTAPAAALDELAAAVTVQDGDVIAFSNVSVLAFFRHVLVPDDLAEFDKLVRDKDRVVTIQTLGDVLLWLGEQYSDGRPTTPSSSSTPTAG